MCWDIGMKIYLSRWMLGEIEENLMVDEMRQVCMSQYEALW